MMEQFSFCDPFKTLKKMPFLLAGWQMGQFPVRGPLNKLLKHILGIFLALSFFWPFPDQS